MANQMSISIIKVTLLVSLVYVAHSSMTQVKKWASAHGGQVLTIAFYNDGSRFVSGSDDDKVKIWSMSNFTVLHTESMGDDVMYVALHPVDNRIFILCYDGELRVLDPNTYTQVHSNTYPAIGGGGNTLSFFANNSKFLIAGYDGAGVSPAYHIYDANTNTSIAGGPTTTFPPGAEIYATSVSKDSQFLAIISKQAAAPIETKIYNLASNTLVTNFADNYDILKGVLFSPYIDQFYLVSNDMTLKTYGKNPQTSKYDILTSFSTKSFGFPNCLNANIKGQLLFSANDKLVFLDISKNYPQVLFSKQDQADVYVCDITKDGKYVVSGMRNGQITIWQLKTDIKPKNSPDYKLIIILVCSIGGFVLLLLVTIIIYCCCFRTPKIVENLEETRNEVKAQCIKT